MTASLARPRQPGRRANRKNYLKTPPSRPTRRPWTHSAVRARQHRQQRLVPRRPLGVLRRRIREHRRHRRVVPQIVEHDLVERVAIGMPRVLTILRVAGLQAERRSAATDERGVIAARIRLRHRGAAAARCRSSRPAVAPPTCKIAARLQESLSLQRSPRATCRCPD